MSVVNSQVTAAIVFLEDKWSFQCGVLRWQMRERVAVIVGVQVILGKVRSAMITGMIPNDFL